MLYSAAETFLIILLHFITRVPSPEKSPKNPWETGINVISFSGCLSFPRYFPNTRNWLRGARTMPQSLCRHFSFIPQVYFHATFFFFLYSVYSHLLLVICTFDFVSFFHDQALPLAFVMFFIENIFPALPSCSIPSLHFVLLGIPYSSALYLTCFNFPFLK